uniref:G-protein coupled receptors family 1 profile domain-containing protein n=2 Tax=Xenopus tropicalis TaxID=8364 RepID=A0A803K5K8_XENTR|eukprot:XP_002938261.2 PREDICTED: free fatty acid receptor 3-like [Xenopus tropicalis]
MMEYFDGAPWLFLIVYIITFVAGLPLNLLAFVTLIRKFRQQLVSIDILLFNLTVSDLLLLAFLPFRIVEAASGMDWFMPYVFCPLSFFMYFSSIYITSLFLMAISVERYLAVAYPIKYKLLKNPVYSVLGSVVIWILGTMHCSVVYIVEHFIPANMNKTNVTRCYDQFSPEQLKILLPVRLEMFVVLFCIPLLVTVFCYFNFVKILVAQPRIQKEKKKRAIGLVVATLINFILCFMPYNVSHVVGYMEGESPLWRTYVLLLSTFNSTVDPVIFYFSSASFKKMFLEGLLQVMNKIQLGSCWGSCMERCKKAKEDTYESHGS